MHEIERYLLVLILAVAVGQDLYCGKIRNSLIIAGGLCGLTLALLSGDNMEACSRFMGFLFPLIFLYVLFVVGGLGAGDIKLFAVVGSFIGVRSLLHCIVAAFFVAAAYGMIILIQERRLWDSLRRMVDYLKRCAIQRRMLYWPDEEQSMTMSFSVTILISVWMYLEGWI